MTEVMFGKDLMHRPMKLWELFSVFHNEDGLLATVFDSPQWQDPYKGYLQDHEERNPRQWRDRLDAFVPLELSRELASRSNRRYLLYRTSADTDVFWVREYDEEVQPADIVESSEISALDVHERFGGAVIEEVLEKGSCDVIDRQGWQSKTG